MHRGPRALIISVAPLPWQHPLLVIQLRTKTVNSQFKHLSRLTCSWCRERIKGICKGSSILWRTHLFSVGSMTGDSESISDDLPRSWILLATCNTLHSQT